MNKFYVSAFAASFLFAIIFVPLVRKLALGIGFVDVPSARKVHKSPIPLGGGLPVILGSLAVFALVVFLFKLHLPESIIGMIAGTLLLTVVGLFDDFHELDFITKLMGQIVAAIIFVAFLDKYSAFLSLPVQIAFTIIWIVALENAFNFLDNMDGLCAGVSMIIAIGLGILFLLKEMPVFAVLSFATAGGTLGFLRYNIYPAKIFLGDAGSLFLGFMLSCLAIVHLNTSKSLTVALAPILIMTYPIFDLMFVSISRIKEGRKVYVGGKDHSSHKISFMGLTQKNTVFVIQLINLLLVISAVVLFLNEYSPYYTLVIAGLALLLSFVGVHLYKNFLFLKERFEAGLFDLIAINSTLLVYYYIKYESGLFVSAAAVSIDTLPVLMAWISIFWILLFAGSGFYDVPFELRFRGHLSILTKNIIFGALVFLLANFKPGVGFQISLVSFAIFMLLLFAIGSSLRAILYARFSGKFTTAGRKMNAVVVNPTGAIVAGSPGEIFGLRYNLLGYIGAETDYGLKRLGDSSEMEDVLRVTKAARVILDVGESDYRNLTAIFESPYYMETIFIVRANGQDNLRGLKRYRSNDKHIDIISIRHRRLFPRIVRRLLDLVFSIAALILASPYQGIKALIAGRKKNKILRQVEIVLRGEKKTKIKAFYGMANSDAVRNYAALLSVLKGYLSLYGPTITTVDEYELSKDSIPGYWRKFLLKPGLFGPGYSGRTPDERFKLDLAYMEKTSLCGDLIMMARQILRIPVSREIETKHA
jgi:UDP-GlcNAc:undecaprenyl-phosphate GlcNAc-1-phosphate transferase